MSSLVIGIDQSLNHTGLCILNTEGVLQSLELIEPKKLRGNARLKYIRDSLEAALHGKEFLIGVLEGYSYGSINRKFDLGEVGAVVKLALLDHSEIVYAAAPVQLKKFVTTKASAGKAEVISAIEKQWDLMLENDNLADAYGLARIALEIAHCRTTKRHQLEILRAIENGPRASKKKPTLAREFKDAL